MASPRWSEGQGQGPVSATGRSVGASGRSVGPSGRLASPRARLFLALELPPPTRAALATWRDEAIAGRQDLRPVAPEALHVTLVFLGYQPEREVPRIAETAFSALAYFEAPHLAARGVQSVPRRRPRLIALALEDLDGAAAALQSAVSSVLEEAGLYRPEKRPFWPHVTLARVKGGYRAEELHAAAPPGEAFESVDVTLYRSILRPQGARYEPLERFRLGP